METHSLSLKDAEAFLKDHERHYKMPVEPIAAIGLIDDGNLHGAVILGRNENGLAEIGHIYCDGAFHGYTLLYGSAWRAFKALGYKTAAL